MGGRLSGAEEDGDGGEDEADFGNRPLSLEVLTAKKAHLMEPSVFT